MHQPYRPVPNSQAKKIFVNISLKHYVNNVCLLVLAVLPCIFFRFTTSFDLSFRWIVDQSVQLSECRIEFSLTLVGLDLSTIHSKLNVEGSPENSHIYLSVTEEKLFGNEYWNGSLLVHRHAK